MSIRKKVSIRLAVQEASEDMGGGDSRMFPVMLRWAIRAEEKIGSFTQYRREYVTAQRVDVHRFELPCHVKAVMGIMCGCRPTDEMQVIFRGAHQYYGGAVNANVGLNHFLISELGSYYRSEVPLWEIQDNHIVFLRPTNVEALTIDALVMQTDADGYPMVNENHIEAIAAYVEYKRAKKSRWLAAEQRISPGEIVRMKAECGQLILNARAEDNQPTTAERAEIVAMMNDPMTGCASAVWRHADEFYVSGI